MAAGAEAQIARSAGRPKKARAVERNRPQPRAHLRRCRKWRARRNGRSLGCARRMRAGQRWWAGARACAHQSASERTSYAPLSSPAARCDAKSEVVATDNQKNR
eukprot:scaffold165816_cov33-Tisochrysis_lutea.AAC.4